MNLDRRGASLARAFSDSFLVVHRRDRPPFSILRRLRRPEERATPPQRPGVRSSEDRTRFEALVAGWLALFDTAEVAQAAQIGNTASGVTFIR